MDYNGSRPPGHSQLNVTGLDGTTYTGEGETLHQAARDLARRHDPTHTTAWRLTDLGRRALALARLQAAGALR
jgi:hypothetical protein